MVVVVVACIWVCGVEGENVSPHQQCVCVSAITRGAFMKMSMVVLNLKLV